MQTEHGPLPKRLCWGNWGDMSIKNSQQWCSDMRPSPGVSLREQHLREIWGRKDFTGGRMWGEEGLTLPADFFSQQLGEGAGCGDIPVRSPHSQPRTPRRAERMGCASPLCASVSLTGN